MKQTAKITNVFLEIIFQTYIEHLKTLATDVIQ